MHADLTKICSELDQLAAAVKSTVGSDEPFNVAHNNWSFPGLTRAELIEAATSLAEMIRLHSPDSLGGMEARLKDYPRRLVALRSHTVQQLWGNANQAVPAYLETLGGLRRALEPVFASGDPAAETRQALQLLKTLKTRIRTLEATLEELEPRSTALADMIERIEKAHDAADQLPTDLQSLEEARKKVADLGRQATESLESANKEKAKIEAVRAKADEFDYKLRQSAKDADAIIARAEKAYSAATSHGLAAAFSERSKALDVSMWFWVAGLISALGAGAYFGSLRFQELANTLQTPTTSELSVLTNIVLSFLSVGAPVWIAWLATKQIGQRFRLSEDYAFKASVSRAYEGYRREAARIDDELEESRLEARLLESALTRLDEQPLRLVEAATHGSPWHELLESEVVKDAFKTVPDFGRRVVQMAQDTMTKRKPISATSPKETQVVAVDE